MGEMMKIRTILAAFSFVIAGLSGCSTMTPARYGVSADVNQELRKYQGTKAYFATLKSTADYSANCRLMGPIQAADGMTIPQFVQNAFNDEFKFAGVYDLKGTALTGDLNRIEFNSTDSITSGWWDLGLVISSPNGQTLNVANRYAFQSGFDAITACNQTAQALGAAVQELIKKTVRDPRFSSLLK